MSYVHNHKSFGREKMMIGHISAKVELGSCLTGPVHKRAPGPTAGSNPAYESF